MMVRELRWQLIESSPVKGKRRWYIRIVAGNGRILMHSETYNSKTSAIDCVLLMSKAIREHRVRYEDKSATIPVVCLHFGSVSK